jgi:sulfoxide reductase catalytic subunit YedY
MQIVSASLGFPLWLRASHYINLLFIGLLIRSGIQIIDAHPRFYWKGFSKPGTEWIKFTTQKVPQDKLYTSYEVIDLAV